MYATSLLLLQTISLFCAFATAVEAANIFNHLLPLPLPASAAASVTEQSSINSNENHDNHKCQRKDAVNELKQLVPPPTRHELGCGDHDAPCDQGEILCDNPRRDAFAFVLHVHLAHLIFFC